jgi:hypothetical protein
MSNTIIHVRNQPFYTGHHNAPCRSQRGKDQIGLILCRQVRGLKISRIWNRSKTLAIFAQFAQNPAPVDGSKGRNRVGVL